MCILDTTTPTAGAAPAPFFFLFSLSLLLHFSAASVCMYCSSAANLFQ